MNKPDTSQADLPFEAVLFQLTDDPRQIYAVEISQVYEVFTNQPISRVPAAAIYFKGICSLRGAVLPVIDLHYLAHQSLATEFGNLLVVQDQEGVLAMGIHSVKGIVRAKHSQLVPANRVFGANGALLSAVLKQDNGTLASVIDMPAAIAMARSGLIEQTNWDCAQANAEAQPA